MLVARRIASLPGIRDASALLATDANRRLLIGMGYGDQGRDREFAAAGPNDLVLALEGEEPAVDAVIASADGYFARGSTADGAPAPEPRSIAEAVAARPDCSVAVISVPGEYAAREARAALQAGLHVFLFSSNVSVEDERSLKSEARQRSLILMGPDCGTAYLSGAGIGFANVVRRGAIGIVGATGTGMQEFSSLVHRAGSGISHGIGTGSRDLSDAIGGISTLTAIDALEADAETKVIAVLSKPPGASASAALAQRLAQCTKPCVSCLLGAEEQSLFTIDDAVRAALREAGEKEPAFLRTDARTLRERAAAEIGKMHHDQRHVRGLFAGGTLCYQAQAIFRRSGVPVYSNAPLHAARELPDANRSQETTFLDMGAELFVKGRPHPMIDATQRKRRLEQEGKDPTVAVVLLDFILGAIASRDPVGDLRGTIVEVQDAARARGGHLCVVASVCGTEEDRQSLGDQAQALQEAGVLVFPSGAQAAAFCAEAALLLAQRQEYR